MNTKDTVEHSAEVKSKISVVAYEKWQNAGQPSGKDMQFWLEAEAQVRTPPVAARKMPTAATAQLPPVASENRTPKGSSGQLGPYQPNSSKLGQTFRWP